MPDTNTKADRSGRWVTTTKTTGTITVRVATLSLCVPNADTSGR